MAAEAAAQEKGAVLEFEFHLVEIFEAAKDLTPLRCQVLFLEGDLELTLQTEGEEDELQRPKRTNCRHPL